MLKRNNFLLIVLAALAGLFLISKFFLEKKTEQTFRGEFPVIDSAAVSEIVLYPTNEAHREIRITRNKNGWTVGRDSFHAEADTNAVIHLLNDLLKMKPEHLAAKSKDKWKDFQLTDSLATRVKLLDDHKNKLRDIMIGRFGFQPQSRSGLTYVRMADEDEVYSVPGLLSMSINQGINNWRNKTFIQVERSDVSKIIFGYPSDSGFAAVKKDSLWFSDTNDTLNMDNYFGAISMFKGYRYADDFRPEGKTPLFTLKIETKGGKTTEVRGYPGKAPGEYIFNSTMNPNTFFQYGAAEIPRLLPRKEDLLKTQKHESKKKVSH